MSSDFSDSYIQILQSSGAIQFGDFVTKAGRKTPVFINAGSVCQGRHIQQLAKLYAHVIYETWPQVECLFGPAYKGIPLAVATSQALVNHHHREVSFSFNRKEIKDHGEGGWLIGDQLSSATNLVIIEDVLTAGTSLRGSLKMIANTPAKVIGVIVGLDREDYGLSAKVTARRELEQEFGLQIQSLSSMSVLAKSPILTQDQRRQMSEYILNRPH